MSDSKSFLPAFSLGNEDTIKFRRKVKASKYKATTAQRSNSRETPSPFVFGCPPSFDKTNEEESFKETTHENGMPENDAKSRSTVLSSALTKAIPCSFEGSSYSYSSQPFFSANEEPVKKEKDETSGRKSCGSQIIASHILKGIPHSPHFWPLRSYSNTAKQTLISAWNTIFEETVAQIQNLQLTDFGIEANRLWETTQELQMMGYNVIPLRRRLIELTDVNLRKNTHKRDKIRLKGKAEQHMIEKNKLEFEILKLKATVEAEKASFEDCMANVARMDAEISSFDVLFSKLAIKPL